MGKNKKKRKRSNPIRISKTKFTSFLVIICVVGIVSYDFIQRSQRDSIERIPQERSLGDPSAQFKIMEFIDFQCSECARGSRLIKRYLRQYPEDIYLGVKYFPNESNLHSIESAVYAECAARQDKFWMYHDLLFKDQTYWRNLSDAKSYFRSLAAKVGVDGEEFDQCVTSEDASLIVKADKALGEARFIQMTPTYFVNNEMVVGYAEMEKKLNAYFQD